MKNAVPRDVVRRLAGALLLAGLSACGGGGVSTSGVPAAGGTEGDAPTLGAAEGATGEPSGETTDGSIERPVGGTAGASPDEVAGPVIAEPVAGTVTAPTTDPSVTDPSVDPVSPNGTGDAAVTVDVDVTFDLALVSVDAKRRSTGERVPIEIVDVSSGELRFVSSEP